MGKPVRAARKRACLMTKLLITEITRMGPAFCVIGLQHDQQKFQSIRPVSATANSWLHFPHQRGEILECSLTPFCGAPPHVEDRISTHGFRKRSTVAENDVAGYLRKAECSDSRSEERRVGKECRYRGSRYE